MVGELDQSSPNVACLPISNQFQDVCHHLSNPDFVTNSQILSSFVVSNSRDAQVHGFVNDDTFSANKGTRQLINIHPCLTNQP